MFGEIKTFDTRKRPAPESMFVHYFSHKENVFVVPEKKIREAKNVCLKCLAGDGGHITHVLSSVPKLTRTPYSVFLS